MSKICYLTYQSFPSVKANTIQTISNLKYFVRNGYDVELIFPLREKNSSDKLEDLQKFYSFNEDIKITNKVAFNHQYAFLKKLDVLALSFIKTSLLGTHNHRLMVDFSFGQNLSCFEIVPYV